MRSRLLRLCVVGVICLVGTQARAEPEIVIAIRYLQAQGTSHSHLYLYREDGKLLRQLTKDNSGQDADPIFTSDGETIVFARGRSDNTREFWSIDRRGTGLKKLDAAPDWYAQTKSSPYFTNIEPEEQTSPTPTASPEQSELVLREDPTDENDQINGEGRGKHYLMRDLKTGTETEFGKLPGFIGVFKLLHDKLDKDRHFLFDGSLRLAFFGLHLNSTDGDTCFALYLNQPRLVRLSPNWATPIPLPGESAFLTLAENRYIPIPESSKTVTCSYMERWDDKLDKIRYAREKSAAICYGASMYRPGRTPPIIIVRKNVD